MARITGIEVTDLRFPTSLELDGSDAMNPDPDYSAAYVRLDTDSGIAGFGFTFTIGRGNELCVEACRSLAPKLVGLDLDDMRGNLRLVWDLITQDSQYRWVGPEKGVVHLATAALVNASWDLLARREGKPVWQFLADLPADELLTAVEFRYIDDAVSPGQALEILQERRADRSVREAALREAGLRAYTTSAGWLGYGDDKLRRLCREALEQGWQAIKIKVGLDREDDLRRCRIVREEIGWDRALMIDANQRWGVDEAIAWMGDLAQFQPLWIEEPTSPDDVLGHARIARAVSPVQVATGEMVQNRIIFKQLLQAEAIGFLQIDSARLGGLNEVLSVLLLAAKFGVPVVPHAGGVGLCEYVQHISAFDALCVAADPAQIQVEYVDHLHEHFADPVVVANGAYRLPTLPGYSAEIFEESLSRYAYPAGSYWTEAAHV